MRLTGLTFCLICLFICLDGGGTVSAQQTQPTGVTTATQGQQALPAQQQTMTTEPVRLISPAENVETIGKKPDIKVELNGQLTDLFVMLDGTDVTQLVKKTENGFTYKPVANLAAGGHTVKVTAKDKDGKMVQKEFAFRLKHYGVLDEAFSNNQLSVISETYLGKAGFVEAGNEYWYSIVALDKAGNRSDPTRHVVVRAGTPNIPKPKRPDVKFISKPFEHVAINFEKAPFGLQAIVQATEDEAKEWKTISGPGGDFSQAVDQDPPKKGKVYYRIVYQAANGIMGDPSDSAEFSR